MFQERTSLIQILGKNVRTERRKANLTMEKLAELSDVSLQTIKDIEHAKRACQVDTLVAIASALHLSPDYLLGFTKFNIENSQNKTDFEFLYHSLSDKQKVFLKEVVKLMLTKL